MKKGVLYIHGKGGSAAEAEHYRALFPDADVTGFDYGAQTPWEAEREFPAFFDAFSEAHDGVILIANSIGAYFSLLSLKDRPVEKAYLISPVVNMERLIADMLLWAGATEDRLKEESEIETDFGETLSWAYLTWVREHPVKWTAPTAVLYGSGDHLQSMDTVRAFAEGCGAKVTVMDGGEHWFHTAEQMAFLDAWILKS